MTEFKSVVVNETTTTITTQQDLEPTTGSIEVGSYPSPSLYHEQMESMRVDYFNQHDESIIHLDHAGSTLTSNYCLKKAFEKLFFNPHTSDCTSGSFHTIEMNKHHDGSGGNSGGQMILSNPHSDGSFSSKITNSIIMEARELILNVFNTSLKDYDLVFTFNASHSLKIISDCFPIDHQMNDDDNNLNHSNQMVGYLKNSHNSLIGCIRSILPNKNNENCQVFSDIQDLQSNLHIFNNHNHHLIGMSAECNSTGDKISDFSIFNYLNKNYPNIYTILDSSKHSSTNVSIDLSKYKPDFIVASLYKWFGYPTGLGILLIRKIRISKINFQPRNGYFSGGSVKINTAQSPFYMKYRNDSFHSFLENGTLPFITISEFVYYFKEIQKIYSNNNLNNNNIGNNLNNNNNINNLNNNLLEFRNIFKMIENHTNYLQQYCINELMKLKHFNGKSLCKIYNLNNYGKTSIINLNFYSSQDQMIGYSQIQELCSLYKFNIRSGCFCVPGACQSLFNLTSETLIDNFERGGKVCWDNSMDVIPGSEIPTGSVRLSFGYCSIKNDIHHFINFIEKHLIEQVNNSIDSSNNTITKTKYNVQLDSIKLLYFYIYPFKSCGAFKVYDHTVENRNDNTVDDNSNDNSNNTVVDNNYSWKLNNDTGAYLDREWAIIDENDSILSMKKCPKLSRIQPEIDMKNRNVNLHLKSNESNNDIITFNIDEYPCTEMENTKVCGREHDSLVYGDQVNERVSEFLGISVRIIRRKPINTNIDNNTTTTNMTNIATNTTTTNNATSKLKQSKCSYSNEGNKGLFLILNKSSLVDLNTKLGNESSNIDWLIERMRPNIVIDGLEAYQEDEIKSIFINDIPFQINSQCSRCTMICINPQTLIQEEEPLKTLYSYRRCQNRVLFGVYGCPFTLLSKQQDVSISFNHISK